MPPKTNEFEQEIMRLESEIRRLEAEYNQFFAGRLPRLPWETRARIDALMKRYDRMNLTNTAQRFRFESVQARFTAFCELWERQLNAREGMKPLRGHRGPAVPERRAEDPGARPAGGARVVHEAALRDPAQDSRRLMDLYERLSDARKAAGEVPLPYHRFVAVVRAQVNKLGDGAHDISFRVSVKDGKVSLTARRTP
ncbi:MAG: MXAN_5187 C-terminal domain-containing protein [Acidobacteriota bacterium]